MRSDAVASGSWKVEKAFKGYGGSVPVDLDGNVILDGGPVFVTGTMHCRGVPEDFIPASLKDRMRVLRSETKVKQHLRVDKVHGWVKDGETPTTTVEVWFRDIDSVLIWQAVHGIVEFDGLAELQQKAAGVRE